MIDLPSGAYHVQPLKILFLSAEVTPFAKAGGLADVCGALPKALAALDPAVAALGWRPDVVHAHDWHAAPAVAWLDTTGRHDPRFAGLPTVYTIHNLMHQGTAPWGVLAHLGLLAEPLREEKRGEVN